MSVQEEILLFCHPKPFYSFLRFSLSHPGMDMDIRFDKVLLVDWPTRKKIIHSKFNYLFRYLSVHLYKIHKNNKILCLAQQQIVNIKKLFNAWTKKSGLKQIQNSTTMNKSML